MRLAGYQTKLPAKQIAGSLDRSNLQPGKLEGLFEIDDGKPAATSTAIDVLSGFLDAPVSGDLGFHVRLLGLRLL
jgi:hypothetical protein